MGPGMVHLRIEKAVHVEFTVSSVFLFTGKIPMGYRYLAQSTSETTHQVPISEFEQAEKDYRKLLGEIENFLDPDWTEKMPPVFSKVT